MKRLISIWFLLVLLIPSIQAATSGNTVYATSDGTLTSPTNLFIKNFPAVNVKWYGAVGNGSTDDTLAISNALRVASAVYFPTGTYLVSDGFTLRSDQMLYGNGNDSAIIGDDTIITMFNATSVSNVAFESFRIAGGCTAGIFFDAANNCVVRNMQITDCDRFKESGVDTCGLWFRQSTNLLIEGNTFLRNGMSTNGMAISGSYSTNDSYQIKIVNNTIKENQGYYAISINDIRDSLIHGNYIDQGNNGSTNYVDGYGIVLYDAQHSHMTNAPYAYNYITGNTVSDNIVTNCYGSGIYLVVGKNNKIIGNTVAGVAQQMASSTLIQGGIILNKCEDTICNNNIVYNIGTTQAVICPGIAFLMGTNSIIANNTIYDINTAYGDGIYIGGQSEPVMACSNLRVTGNTIRNVNRIGIWLDALCDKVSCDISGNTVSDVSTECISLKKMLYGSVTANTLSLWGSGSPAITIDQTTNYFNTIANNTMLVLKTTTGQGIRSISTNNIIANNTFLAASNLTTGILEWGSNNVFYGNSFRGTITYPFLSHTNQSSLYGGNYATNTGHPPSIPLIIGEMSYDTVNKNFYMSVGTTTTNDWKQITFDDDGTNTFMGFLMTWAPTNNNGTAVASHITNLPAGWHPIGQFGYLSMHTTNLLVCSGATADYTNIASATAYSRILTNGFTGSVTTGILTNAYAGYYKVTAGGTIVPEVDNNADEIEMEVFVNGVNLEHLASLATLQTGIYDQMEIHGIVYLEAGSRVEIRIRNESDASSTLNFIRHYLTVTSQ